MSMFSSMFGSKSEPIDEGTTAWTEEEDKPKETAGGES